MRYEKRNKNNNIHINSQIKIDWIQSHDAYDILYDVYLCTMAEC